MNKVNLIKYQSLIIFGPQASGKTILAKKIADNSNGHYQCVDDASLTQMKQMVIDNSHQQFIFTTNEFLDDRFSGGRRFVVKSVTELLNSEIYLWCVAGQIKISGLFHKL